MKQFKYASCIAFLFCTFYASSQIVAIPDQNFKQALIDLGHDLNGDGEIQNSEAEVVTELIVKNKNIQSLEGIRSFVNLKELRADENQLVSLDLTDLNIFNLYLNRNQLTSINLSTCVDLGFLEINRNDLNVLDISNSKRLKYLYAEGNNLTSIDETSLDSIVWFDVKNNQFEELDFSNMKSVQFLYVNNNNLKRIDIRDLNELAFFSAGMNEELTELLYTPNQNLLSFNISTTQLENIDFSIFPQLTFLFVDNLLPQNFLLNQNPALQTLSISNNGLSSLDISNLPNLNNLDCSENPIQNLDLSNQAGLKTLDLSECSQLMALDLSNNQEIKNLNIDNTTFEEIIGTNFPNLVEYDGSGAQVKFLDFSNSNNLDKVDIDYATEILLLKNGANETVRLPFSYNSYLSQLQYICQDEDQLLDLIENFETYYEDANPLINSYCSFVPGGAIYSINGRNTLDHNNNGCDENDFFIPHLKYDISNTQGIEGAIITDESGLYNIDLQEETHTIRPRFENPGYFNSDPASIVVDFPTETSPYVQDFCISGVGEKNDLEVIIIPSKEIRPGFKAVYSVSYKNKGNTVQSGNVRFSFERDKMEIINLTQNIDFENSNSIGWNFEDLLPLESRTILIGMEFNTPMDDIPINGGDELVFRAKINPVDNDLTELDNLFRLKQIAVNSFDPNDKTCLQGEFLDLEKVGDFVHYMVRFENTGTANAINVVVVDTLDVSKFDIQTLQVVDASHSAHTRVRDNIAEFHFENIQLPFDDENNDGFIVFKIKTLESLVVGDAFANSAAIHFDFNFPIITNNYITTVVQIVDEDGDGFNEEDDCDDNNPDINPLAEEIPGNGIDEDCNGEDFITSIDEFKEYSIEIYPNPNEGIFNLEIEFEALAKIYDLNGRHLKEFSLSQGKNKINLEELNNGMYLLMISQESRVLGTQKLVIN